MSTHNIRFHGEIETNMSYLELYIFMQNIVDDILKYFSEKVRPVI